MADLESLEVRFERVAKENGGKIRRCGRCNHVHLRR
jgi:hypothetical protein